MAPSPKLRDREWKALAKGGAASVLNSLTQESSQPAP